MSMEMSLNSLLALSAAPHLRESSRRRGGGERQVWQHNTGGGRVENGSHKMKPGYFAKEWGNETEKRN